ncbi:MAG: sel1 repeat family protein [Magnetococcales bacterium]|nr:sel1 repeat family protein [Magnetococcales bacterium]NGZ28313.1 sel1 repeat family protein [Magnetococcales bacterium]
MTISDNSPLYRVVFTGQIKPGIDPSLVKKQLAKIYHLARLEDIERVFTTPRVTMRKGLSKEDADKMLAALDGIGLVCHLVEESRSQAAVAPANVKPPVTPRDNTHNLPYQHITENSKDYNKSPTTEISIIQTTTPPVPSVDQVRDPNQRYKLVYLGAKDGQITPKFCQDFASTIGKNTAFVEQIVSGSKTVINQGLTLSLIEQWKASLEKKGVLCAIELDAYVAPPVNVGLQNDAATKTNGNNFSTSKINPGEKSKHLPNSSNNATKNDEIPNLWNPNAVGIWSLFLTPIFGGILLAKNWRAMGQYDREKKSIRFVWLYVIASVLLSYAKMASGGFSLVIVWYFLEQSPQTKYVQNQYNNKYNKNSWIQPLFYVGKLTVMIGILFSIGIFYFKDGLDYNNGLKYLEGKEVTQDYGKAIDYFQKAAQKGNAKAKHNLGIMYYKGLGVSEDHAVAAKWFLDAANQGLAESQIMMFSLYFKGDGVPPDFTEGYKWLILAEKSGNEKAREVLPLMPGKIPPGNVAEAQSLAQQWKATKN